MTVTVVVDVAKNEAAETTKWLNTPANMNTLGEDLTEAGFETSGMTVTKTFQTSEDQKDRFTCYDGLLSEGESDVDCGGVCSTLCKADQKCKVDQDCESGKCENNICTRKTWNIGMVLLIVLFVVILVVIVFLFVCLYRCEKEERMKEERTVKEIEMAVIRHEKNLKEEDAREEEIARQEQMLAHKQRKQQPQPQPQQPWNGVPVEEGIIPLTANRAEVYPEDRISPDVLNNSTDMNTPAKLVIYCS